MARREVTIDPGDLARLLKIPVIKAYVEFEVTDKDGKVILKREQESHSWVRNLYHLVFCQGAGVAYNTADGLAITVTGGTPVSSMTAQPSMCGVDQDESLRGAADNDDVGIVSGTNSDAEDFEDYALGARIDNGTGAGELTYVGQEATVVSTVDTTKKAELVRYFNNNSGAAITVEEVALYARMASISAYATCGSLGYVMMCRDLTGGVSVPDTGQLKVTYTIEFTYPS